MLLGNKIPESNLVLRYPFSSLLSIQSRLPKYSGEIVAQSRFGRISYSCLLVGFLRIRSRLAVPAGAVAGLTYSRFRCSDEYPTLPVGGALDGEVEDYVVNIELLLDIPGLGGLGLVVLAFALATLSLATIRKELGR